MDATASKTFPDRGPAVLAVTTATLVLCSVFVLARMVCRLGIVRRVGWDDYFIILAWLLAFGLSLTINLGTRTGLGRYDANIPPEGRARLRIREYVFSILYNPALMATKTSILIFYLRLSKNTVWILRLGSYIVLIIVNVAGIVLTFINIFQCRPVAAAFKDVPGQCIPLLTEFICSAPVNIVTDLAILALPIPVLTGMRLPTRQKTILVLTFALGIFVAIVDVVRIYYLQQAINIVRPGSSSDPNSIFGDGTDFAWNASFSFMWSAVEVNVGITCACIPTLKPLIIKIFPALVIDPYASDYGSSYARGLDTSNASSRLGAAQPARPAMAPAPAAGGAAATNNEVARIATREGSGTPLILGGPESVSQGQGSSLDSGSPRPPDLATNQISAADHAQDARPAKPAAGENLDNAASPDAQASPRSPLARATFGARHAVSAVTHHLHHTHPHKSKSSSDDKDQSVYFGFVKLNTPKNMLEATASESWRYCTIVAILFFLWGFSYGLLNTLNNVVAAVANMTTTQTVGLTSAYFGGGYFFGPLVVGEWVLRHDEHHRRRASESQRRDSQPREKRRKRATGLATIPATAATVASHATSTIAKHSRFSESSDNQIGGFKATFMVGLCFYGIGTIMFWPSAVLTSFPGFLISSFVVGFGLSILETAANPFLVLCGPMEYAEMRLLLAQGTQGVGSVLSGLLAQNVFFVNVGTTGSTNSTTLLDVQWTYLAITLFCVVLILFFYYMPLPELHDAELELAASRMPVHGTKRSVFGLQLRTICLILAVFAQWTYVASQESMSIYFHDLITSWLPGGATTTSSLVNMNSGGKSNQTLTSTVVFFMATSSINPSADSDNPAGLSMSVPNYLSIARTAFSVSRFFAGFIVYLGVKHPKNRWLPTPRTILTISTVLMTVFALLIVVLHPSSNANLIMVPVTLFFLAEGPMWPLIFAIGLRGQGTRTKRAAAYITMGASGPLFWPFVMYAIMDRGGTIQIAFIIVVALMAACTIYPLYLTFVRDARELTKVAPYDSRPRSGQAPSGGRHPARGFVGELDMSILGNGPDGNGSGSGSGQGSSASKAQPNPEPRTQQAQQEEVTAEKSSSVPEEPEVVAGPSTEPSLVSKENELRQQSSSHQKTAPKSL
ncbi:hypothetical protein Sste5346_010269 [Sporothrix stenoceras]|uniref:Rhodopsin domain-containing protein n=1 Tax=Sporothrix stenoceras TaxID=5173 RepID=A0ABR3YIV8_9PEZI